MTAPSTGEVRYRRDGTPYQWRQPRPFDGTEQITHGARMANLPDDEIETARLELFEDTTPRRVVEQYVAEIHARRKRALADIDKRGLTLDDKPHPLLRHVDTWENKILAAMREWGGTPMAELELTRRRLELRDHAYNTHGLDALAAEGRELQKAYAWKLEDAQVLDAVPAAETRETGTQAPLVEDGDHDA